MAKYQKFEDLPVWQEGARLYNRVLDLLEEPHLPLSPGYRNQLDRAALSVSNNIAEGFERVTRASSQLSTSPRFPGAGRCTSAGLAGATVNCPFNSRRNSSFK